MKKTFLLSKILICLILFSSCSDDNLSNNSIVGTWKMVSHSDLTTLTDCMKNSTITFNSNNSFGGTTYEADCDKNIVSGSYIEINDSEYKIEIPNYDAEITASINNGNLTWIETNSFKTRTVRFNK